MSAGLSLLRRSAALALLAALAACSRRGSAEAVYVELAASDLAIGAPLGTARTDVEAALGAPDQTKEKQRGLYVEAFYITRALEDDPSAPPPIPDLLGPQLKLTYVDGKLAQVYNAYKVDEAKPLPPPRIIEPLAGVKIGARRSDLQKLLGKPLRSGADQDEWRYSNETAAISVQVRYLHVEAAQADLAAALTLSAHSAAEQSRGEQFDKNKQVRDSIHGQ